jgi:hypothetical protein
MHIVYSELHDRVLLFDIVFLIPRIPNDSLISVARYA